MKVVILAGGFGTRLYEETISKPKPLVEIGGKPILWHIMKIYSSFGLYDFIICSGHKKEKIFNYFQKNFRITDKMNVNRTIKFIISGNKMPLLVTLVDTGLNTMTGGRLKKVENLIDSTFCFTYGDTLNDINIKKLLQFHKRNKALATVTACHPPEKYGILKIHKNRVTEFKEKPTMKKVWVNGGFFVLEPQVFDYIKNDQTVWEKEPMMKLAKESKMYAYKHEGFYQPMDTMSDKLQLEKIWKSGIIPWKNW